MLITLKLYSQQLSNTARSLQKLTICNLIQKKISINKSQLPSKINTADTLIYNNFQDDY